MASVEIRPDLEAAVTAEVVVPFIDDVLDMLQNSARALAPDAKVWISMRDDLVRRSHRGADGQAIPANLRYKVPKVNTGDDVNDVRAGYDLARFPRDPALPIGNRINCRCHSQPSPHLFRTSIERSLVTSNGTGAEGFIYTDFERAAESEFGTTEDPPSLFMHRAGVEVSQRLSSWSP